MPREFPLEGIGDLYRQTILDHYRKAGLRVPIDNPDIEFEEYNPFCGDGVVLQLIVEEDRINRASFRSKGCSIAQASASMMADHLEGISLDEAQELSGAFRAMMNGGLTSDGPGDLLGDLAALEEIRRHPVRIKCALLAWAALEQAIAQYRERTGSRRASQ